uniref:Uncharacterized protein n=1 Tax=Trypanosoma congolense (strain IL3000) TaxID=1068625 RepID=G0UX32_TRYCI|nr:conserved hypothetical protein [Trypanosoma congolense IL3000]
MDMLLVDDDDKEIIDRLLASKLPRSLSRHAIIVLHCFRTVCKVKFHPSVLFYSCLSYSLKWRVYADGEGLLAKYSHEVDINDITACEMLLHEVVRQNVLLIEACLRSVLFEISQLGTIFRSDRERVIQMCLHLSSELYKTRWCLLPETSARGILLLALEKCNVDVNDLPSTFKQPMVIDIVQYLRVRFSQ